MTWYQLAFGIALIAFVVLLHLAVAPVALALVATIFFSEKRP